MHGVRLVNTPPAKTSGTASSGFADSSDVRFEKFTRNRDVESKASFGERYDQGAIPDTDSFGAADAADAGAGWVRVGARARARWHRDRQRPNGHNGTMSCFSATSR